jgi:predicted branched-subunit amino acid permease
VNPSPMPAEVLGRFGVDAPTLRAITRQSLSIGLSVAPFGLAFGVACVRAHLSWPQAMAFSTLVFTGGTQFAAVGVLADGGSASAAIVAGLLLAVRLLVYGIVMTPVLRGTLRFRAAASFLMLDESVAVSSGQPAHDMQARKIGFLVGGLSIFAFWNVSTLIGAIAFSNAGSFIKTWGIDATIPAAFAALVWPRLLVKDQRRVAIGGAVIALCAIPLVPPGMPIVLASAAVVLGLRGSAPTSKQAPA